MLRVCTTSAMVSTHTAGSFSLCLSHVCCHVRSSKKMALTEGCSCQSASVQCWSSEPSHAFHRLVERLKAVHKVSSVLKHEPGVQDADIQRGVLQQALQGTSDQNSQSTSPQGGSTPSGKEPSGTSQRRQRRSSMGPDLLSGNTRPGNSRPGHMRRHRRSSLGPTSTHYADIEHR